MNKRRKCEGRGGGKRIEMDKRKKGRAEEEKMEC